VLDLLDSGIAVVTAVNIQHLESLNDAVETTTGVRVRETVRELFRGERTASFLSRRTTGKG